jgi:hypothetical protein
MKRLLKVGDVFKLEKGMAVYTELPAKFVYVNKSVSDAPAHTKVVVGETRCVENIDWAGIGIKLCKEIKHQFEFMLGGAPPDREIELFISNSISRLRIPTGPNTRDMSYLAGEYVVVAVNEEDGGPDGMNGRDSYPDGHHVKAIKLTDGEYDPHGVKIDFYQTGCFSAMITQSELTLTKKIDMGYK